MKNIKPFIAVHPCETIKAEIEARRMSHEQFFRSLTMYSRERLIALLNGERPITPSLARALERVLGMPSEFWMRLQKDYDEQIKNKDDE